ncbi:Uncharacterised protein [Clostridium putrefaciens]|uniref:Uncharacterized protein n=1 Tax=Clostridium putrefaciens TaxID=99675 RepID=A0A381JBS6_9CLOT|nr:hypothetical protein [Clostridium putrefaciens]SUY48443.1 Uncharacterised protein [Clostridium putrefaciens]
MEWYNDSNILSDANSHNSSIMGVCIVNLCLDCFCFAVWSPCVKQKFTK